MKQRALLAQALLNDPKILILDDPTAGLDPKERIRIRNFISEIAEDKIVLKMCIRDRLLVILFILKKLKIMLCIMTGSTSTGKSSSWGSTISSPSVHQESKFSGHSKVPEQSRLFVSYLPKIDVYKRQLLRCIVFRCIMDYTCSTIFKFERNIE